MLKDYGVDESCSLPLLNQVAIGQSFCHGKSTNGLTNSVTDEEESLMRNEDVTATSSKKSLAGAFGLHSGAESEWSALHPRELMANARVVASCETRPNLRHCPGHGLEDLTIPRL